ncbi:hypothetical protein [Nocardia sp. NPDC003963]
MSNGPRPAADRPVAGDPRGRADRDTDRVDQQATSGGQEQAVRAALPGPEHRHRAGAEAAPHGSRLAEYAFAEAEADTVPSRVAPVSRVAHSAPPPVAPTEHARRDDYAGQSAGIGGPADTTWSVPEAEALELLPTNGHALLGLCIGVVVLLAVGFFYLGRTSGPDYAAAPTAATAVSTMTPRETAVPAPAESPDIGTGFAWGKVLTNDGSTLTIKSEINHSEIVVHTDEHTKVYVLVASTIEAIAEGAPIVVYGRKHEDGSIFADSIAGVSLRALGSG